MTEGRVPANSRAVLVGVSAYEYAEFPPIRAARNSIQAMHSLLADPVLCGWPPELITVIADPTSSVGLAEMIADFAEDTTGILLLYYVGHGVLSARGELCLTVTSTRPSRPKITGLPWESLADALRTCPAQTRLVILDCCFSGQAIEALSGEADQGLADIAHVNGVYTLTATTRNRTAHVPPPGQQETACTSFTGELDQLVRAGIPGKPAWLSFSDLYPALRQRLWAKGLPLPSQRGTDTAHQFPFTANAAVLNAHLVQSGGNGGGRIQQGPAPVQTDRSRATRLLADALHAASLTTDERRKVSALSSIAKVMAASDPEHAAKLIADAERIVQSMTDERSKAFYRSEIAESLATIDPGRAESIAKSIAAEDNVALDLHKVVRVIAATDPDRAERIAQSLQNEYSRDWVLSLDPPRK